MLASGLVTDLLGVKATYVHYKGSAPATTDLVAGRVDLYLSTGLGAIPMLKAGKTRALALANPGRSPLFPDLVSAADMGAPGFDYASIYGIIAPAGVPRPVVNSILALLHRAAKDPEVVKRIETDGGFMEGSTPEQFRKIMIDEIARYKKIAADNGNTLEDLATPVGGSRISSPMTPVGLRTPSGPTTRRARQTPGAPSPAFPRR